MRGVMRWIGSRRTTNVVCTVEAPPRKQQFSATSRTGSSKDRSRTPCPDGGDTRIFHCLLRQPRCSGKANDSAERNDRLRPGYDLR